MLLDQRATAIMSHDLRGGAESVETEVCARCGAPISYQPSAADLAVAQRAGRGDPSRRLLFTAGVAAALVVVGGLIAGVIIHSRYSTHSVLSTDQLTIYQLQTGDCLQDSGLANFNECNGPFTAVPCTQPHTAEVFFAGNAWPRSLAYPGDQAVYDDGLASCLTAFSAYDGIDSSLSAFGVVSSTPDSSTWPGGDRRLACSPPRSRRWTIRSEAVVSNGGPCCHPPGPGTAQRLVGLSTLRGLTCPVSALSDSAKVCRTLATSEFATNPGSWSE